MASVETAWSLALKCTADRDLFTVTPIYTISDLYVEGCFSFSYIKPGLGPVAPVYARTW